MLLFIPMNTAREIGMRSSLYRVGFFPGVNCHIPHGVVIRVSRHMACPNSLLPGVFKSSVRVAQSLSHPFMVVVVVRVVFPILIVALGVGSLVLVRGRLGLRQRIMDLPPFRVLPTHPFNRIIKIVTFV